MYVTSQRVWVELWSPEIPTHLQKAVVTWTLKARQSGEWGGGWGGAQSLGPFSFSLPAGGRRRPRGEGCVSGAGGQPLSSEDKVWQHSP